MVAQGGAGDDRLAMLDYIKRSDLLRGLRVVEFKGEKKKRAEKMTRTRVGRRCETATETARPDEPP